jgi:hypothetical protein
VTGRGQRKGVNVGGSVSEQTKALPASDDDEAPRHTGHAKVVLLECCGEDSGGGHSGVPSWRTCKCTLFKWRHACQETHGRVKRLSSRSSSSSSSGTAVVAS